MDSSKTEALRKWYSRSEILDVFRSLANAGKWEELEEFLQKDSLLPLGRHDTLPDYLKTAEDTPLFPENLSPAADIEEWRDAVDIGWEVVEENLGITRDEVHIKIRDAQDADWKSFIDRAKDRRKKPDPE